MADLATLRRRQRAARHAFALAEAEPKWKRGRAKAGRSLIRATAELLRAEINHRIAAPLLRAQARRETTGDLFNQIGA